MNPGVRGHALVASRPRMVSVALPVEPGSAIYDATKKANTAMDEGSRRAG